MGFRYSTWAVAAILLAFAGGCGGNDGPDERRTPVGGASQTDALFRGTAADARANPEAGGKRGGVITMLSAGDVDSLDPAIAYGQYSWQLIGAMQRGLFAYAPGDSARPVPDLAAALPEVSPDGRRVSVRIRRGVHFSRPVDREVTAADVKYAIERAFTANVAGPYVRAYFGSLIGAPSDVGVYLAIPGIETPDRGTIVFRLSDRAGAALAGALAMPVTVPVPKEYARRFDAENPSTYALHQVFTGHTRSRRTTKGS